MQQRLEDRRIDVTIGESAREFIAREGFDPVYGARPLKRYLQHVLETRIGRALIAGDVRDGAEIAVELEDGELVVRHENRSQTGVASEQDAVGVEIV